MFFDDYEIQEEYDFSDGVRGRFYEPKKIPVSLRLDNDIVLFFKKVTRSIISTIEFSILKSSHSA